MYTFVLAARRWVLLFALLALFYVLLAQPSNIRSKANITAHMPFHTSHASPLLNLSEAVSPDNHDSHKTDSVLRYGEHNAQLSTGDSRLTEKLTHGKTLKVPSASLFQLTHCPIMANQHTKHIRLQSILYNISMTPWFSDSPEMRKFWNPTILSLPSWAENQYLIISMVLLKGAGYRQNVLCEANICEANSKQSFRMSRTCSKQDLAILGPNGGMRCATAPIDISVPWVFPARCEGKEQELADIAGFHDPRLFYSGRGEPLLMLSSQSRYACIGLWAVDLRKLYPCLESTFSSSPKRLGPGPLMSYPELTELTRNPPETRRSYEKNWLMFSPTPSSSYIQYELTATQRTFAKLVGGGYTTTNMTYPLEERCLLDATPDEIAENEYLANGTWHQATPALKLILCKRTNLTCQVKAPEIVFFAAIHRQHKNYLQLPIRYERYFVLWSAKSPFSMLAVSQHPVLFANETTTGWTSEETWDDVLDAKYEHRGFWAKFTYTTTISYAARHDEGDVRDKGTGFLDDEVIVSVGVDDIDQAFGRVTVEELLGCLRLCNTGT